MVKDLIKNTINNLKKNKIKSLNDVYKLDKNYCLFFRKIFKDRKRN